MKRYISFIMCMALLIACFCGCNSYEPIGSGSGSGITDKPVITFETYEPLPDKVLFENDLYKIERISDICYISFYEPDETDKDNNISAAAMNSVEQLSLGDFIISDLQISRVLYFDSIQELIQTVLVDGLTADRLDLLFPHLKGPVEIIDPERLSYIKMPEDFSVTEVRWTGEVCSMQLNSNSGCYKRDSWISVYVEREYNYYFRRATVIEEGLSKEKYEFKNGEMNYSVYEVYYQGEKPVFDRVDIYGSGKGIFFKAVIKANVDKTKSPPDNNWIAQFDIMYN